MAPRLSIVGTSPADQARALQNQAKGLTRAAVDAFLKDVDALVGNSDEVLSLEVQPGVRQSLERIKRVLVAESLQISSLRERG